MATVTWQGDDLTNPTYWNDADNWDTGTVPTTGDDVVLTGANDCFINEATAALNSFTMLGFTGHLTGTFNMTVTVASGTSAVVFDNGADASNTWSGTLLLNPATGTTINLTAGGWTTWGGITIAGTTTGIVNMLDSTSLAATKIVTLTSGTLNTDGGAGSLAHTWGKFTTGVGTKTLVLGDSTITITGTGVSWTWSTTNATLTEGTSTIILSGAGATFTGGVETYHALQLTGTGTAIISAETIFTDLSRTHAGALSDYLQLSANQTVTGTLTLTGNSAVNRILVYASTLGTPAVITCSGATISANNVDLRDITFARSDSGALDLTAGGTTSIGDCGGNSKTLGDSATLTMTSPTTTTCTGAGGYWSTRTWDVRAPLPQDTVVISLTTGQTLTTDMPRLGKNISFGTATKLTLGSSVSSFGSLNMTGAGTFSLGASCRWTFESQLRSGSINITTAAKQFTQGVNFSAPNTTINLLDAFDLNSNNSFLVTNGTLTTNYNVTTDFFTFSAGTTVNMGSGTWSFKSGTSAVSASCTLNSEQSTISCTATNNKTFAGGGKIYNNLTKIAGSGTLTISGNNTFNTIWINETTPSAQTLTLTPGSVQTVTNFNATGTAGNIITLNTGGAAATLTKVGGGKIQLCYVSITAINVTPPNTWYYCPNSVLNSGTGWVYGYIPKKGYAEFMPGLGFGF